ncbi:hypothetical protein D3C87_88370 [compost metagenome]
MKIRMNKTTWRAASGIVGSFLLVVSFQNCGKAGFDGSLDESIDLTSDAALSIKYGGSTAAKVANIPFAYDATFDQIAYNSCAKAGLQQSQGYFSIMAGAYGTFGGGTKLSQQFFNYTDANFNPIYPETRLSENQYREYLADSPANSEAQPLLAIRSSDRLTDIHSSNSSATLGIDVIPMLSSLTDTLLMASVTKQGTTASYFPFSSEGKVLEGKLTFNKDESLAQAFRDDLMGNGLMTLAYTKKNGEINEVRAPSSAYPVKKAYGRGYKLTFGNTNAVMGGSSRANNPANILTEVYEGSLENPSSVGVQWNCHITRRYMVVRPQDAATVCPAEAVDNLANANYRHELQIVRRHLRADQWDVNLARRCVVPKLGASTSCYAEEQIQGQSAGVQYDRSLECFQSNKDAGHYANGIPVKRCAQFISVCTRN